MSTYASRAGEKLATALDQFAISVAGLVCADLGSNTGGFVDCLLQRGATRVFAVDNGYGVLDWRLRNDPRVVVRERTNAMYVELPELVDFISIDVGWTRQRLIVPHALELLRPGGAIVSLIKPHYEADRAQLDHGKVRAEELPSILDRVRAELGGLGITIEKIIESPIEGGKGGNKEFLALINRRAS